MPWYCYLAFKQLFPSGRRLSLHTVFYLLSLLGVILGVFLLVVSQSVMGGFGEMWKDKITKTNGDINILSQQPIVDYPTYLERLESEPGVKAAAPFAQGIGLLQHRGVPALPAVLGLDIERGPAVLPIAEFLIASSLDDLDDYSVLLSTSLASSLGVRVGDVVEFHTPLMIERIKEEELLMPRELLVVGLFRTGWPDFDRSSMVVTLGLMQEFYDLGEGIHRIALRLEPDVNADEVAQRLNTSLAYPLRAVTWSEQASDFLWVLGFERFMIFVLTIPINLVGGFVIVCAQLLTIVSKTREIGLIGALGGTPRQLMAGYCFQGFLIGALGSGLGVLLGILFLSSRDEIVKALAHLTGSEAILEQFYAFTALPVDYSWINFVFISLSAILLSTLASIIPAIFAAKKKPADALRSG